MRSRRSYTKEEAFALRYTFDAVPAIVSLLPCRDELHVRRRRTTGKHVTQLRVLTLAYSDDVSIT